MSEVFDTKSRLAIIKIIAKHKDIAGNTRRMALCECDCGNRKVIREYNVIKNITKSCGCLQKEQLSNRFKKHDMTKTTEYTAWINMKYRCYNKKSLNYDNYGGRGIIVSGEWKDDFIQFYKDIGERPSKKHSIDRLDNDGDYTKDNCKWATQKEQCRNKRNNLTYKGECAIDASERLGGGKDLVTARINKHNWDIHEAFTAPIFRRL